MIDRRDTTFVKDGNIYVVTGKNPFYTEGRRSVVVKGGDARGVRSGPQKWGEQTDGLHRMGRTELSPSVLGYSCVRLRRNQRVLGYNDAGAETG